MGMHQPSALPGSAEVIKQHIQSSDDLEMSEQFQFPQLFDTDLSSLQTGDLTQTNCILINLVGSTLSAIAR